MGYCKEPFTSYFTLRKPKLYFNLIRSQGSMANINNITFMRATVSMNSNLFVTYFVSQQTESQQKSIDNFLTSKEQPTQIVDTFVEILENRRNNKWSQLQQAIACCKEKQATLLIAELGTLTSKETFVNTLLHCNVNFYCCDQPFVDHGILDALYKHSQVQKEVHGRLIREGLEKTSAKSGNPNAAEVISKVNKPKIDAAIVFAFLLQPIVTNYKQQGYSQRQMVKSLNEEGFTAPEGGKWVLSQLQKVLDRVKINEVVMQTKSIVEPLLSANYSSNDIAEELNKQSIPAIKKSIWDESQVNKILFRLEQIKDIENINKFVLNLLPVIHEFKSRNYSSKQMLQYFENNNITINNAVYN